MIALEVEEDMRSGCNWGVRRCDCSFVKSDPVIADFNLCDVAEAFN